MTRTTATNLIAAAVLTFLVGMACLVGIQGTVDGAYDIGYSLGSLLRAR